jgi:hypothetical protein
MTRRLMARDSSRSLGVVALVLVLATACSTAADAGGRDPAASLEAAVPRGGGCARWVSPSGSDGDAGTRNAPWATLEHAAEALPDRGCTVWFENGTYRGSNSIDRRFDRRAVFRAVNRYQVVLQDDGTVMDFGGGARLMTFRGFEIRQAGSDPSGVMVYLAGDADEAPNHITFTDNLLHDSYDQDLMKILTRSHSIVVRGNVFYNQGDNEQHMDVNSVTNITIEGNIFFNDFARSGRNNSGSTKHYIVVKDSHEVDDGLRGSERITIARNVFLNWQGGLESFVGLGNDGNPFHEAKNVTMVDNLLIGNSTDALSSPLTVFGARDVEFVNNTVVGNLPSESFAFDVDIKGTNPENENIRFSNNIWCDPTGTMNNFSHGDPDHTNHLTLDTNLYWNDGDALPGGELIDPNDDGHGSRRNPRLPTDQRQVVLPFWTGSNFLSGNRAIRQEFVRLVRGYGTIPASSPAVGEAVASLAPARDILGHKRQNPDLGAYEA